MRATQVNKSTKIMVNDRMSLRVLVNMGVTPKARKMFERMLSPEESEKVDLGIIITALRQLFGPKSSVIIEAYG